MASLAAILLSAAPPQVQQLNTMLLAAPHRGEHLQTVTLGNVALGVAQSLELADATIHRSGGSAVAFVGVLDNVAELAAEFQVDGSAPTPAAVLLSGFRRDGDVVAKKLRGAFAAIITDGRRIWALRDHVGFGTLFYRHGPHGTYLASEVKQVLAGAGIAPQPDVEVLERIFFDTCDDETPCALRGVERLPKATVLHADKDGIRRRRYWEPESLLETARFSGDELRSRFDELMAQAVGRSLTGRGDVVSLSGGVDSPAVAAFVASKHLDPGQVPPSALSVIYPKFPSVDERKYIEIVAERLDMPLHTYEAAARPLDDLVRWLRLTDSPAPHVGLPACEEHYRRAVALGARNILTGELAEFVFDLRSFLIPHLLLHGRFSDLRAELSSQRAHGVPPLWLARQLATSVLPSPIMAPRWGRRRRGIPGWMDAGKANEAAVRSLVPPRDRWRSLQIGVFAGPGISLEADSVCQEVCGVRVRKPWADVDLWEFFLSLPAETKFPVYERKALVRGLLRGKVPDEILDRRDRTFFDDSVMAGIDYALLRRWLLRPDHQLAGVDYDMLGQRLQREDLGVEDFQQAQLLAEIHAFLSLW